MIPDYIIGGRNSDGFQWLIVEIKGANQNLFTQNKNLETYFSSELNKGICQTLEYIDYCSANQAHLRDQFQLEEFREPKGIIVMGLEDEMENEDKQKLKAAWNRNNPNIEIRTYSWMVNQLQNLVKILKP